MALQQPIDDMALTTYEQPRNNIIVRPLVRPADMIAAIQEYEALKTAILLPKDVQVISGKTHIKKSGWLRIARAFGLTVEPVSCVYVPDPTGGDDWGYEVVARAIAPNGASMSGDGACWATEKIVKPRGWNGKPPTESDIHKAAEKTLDMQTRHNVRAHAFTRATNRAISNLVGGGEVSAEELGDYIDAEPAAPARTAPMPARPAPRPAPAPAPAQTVVEAEPEHVAPTPANINPSALKTRANELGRAKTSQEWGKLFNEYKNNLQGLSDYLDAYEASKSPSAPDEHTEFEYALEGLPVSGMH